MAWLPCRVCGNPTNGIKSDIRTKSFCCSKNSCIKKDVGTNFDESSIILDQKTWNKKINIFSRGY